MDTDNKVPEVYLSGKKEAWDSWTQWYVPVILALGWVEAEEWGFQVIRTGRVSLRPALGYMRTCLQQNKTKQPLYPKCR